MNLRNLLWASLLSLVALTARAETVVYVHTDVLGSPVLETDANAKVVRQVDYRAYGDEVLGAPRTGPGYTGHYRDESTGLVYMQQRYYDQGIGRFLSVDPMVSDMENGWNFNRYNYAANSPYRYTDPDGRCLNVCTGAIGLVVGAIVGGGIETFKQIKAGDLKWRDIAVETGKGAVVGGLIGLTGGAAAGLSATSGVALTSGVGLGVGSGANAVGEMLKGNAVPSATDNLIAGGYTAIGAGAGQVAGKLLDETLSVAVPAVASHPVTSNSGRTFNTFFQPARVLRHAEEEVALGNFAGSAVEASAGSIPPERNEE